MSAGDAVREQIKHIEFTMSETNHDPTNAIYRIVDALKEVARALDALGQGTQGPEPINNRITTR
jgi:hypothetical protein